MNLHKLLLALVFTVVMTGCSGKYLPGIPGPSAPPVPSQQLLISTAVDRAVNNTPIPPAVNGRTVAVDVVGTYLDGGFAAYIRDTVENSFANSGAIIVAYDPYDEVFIGANPPDYYAVVAMRAGGVDITSDAPYLIYEEKILTAFMDIRLSTRETFTNRVEVTTGTGTNSQIVAKQINLWGTYIPLPNDFVESPAGTSPLAMFTQSFTGAGPTQRPVNDF